MTLHGVGGWSRAAFAIVFLGLILAGARDVAPSDAQQVTEPIVGVNVINPYALSITDQNRMLDEIHAAGVPVIRASISFDDKGVDFADRAWQHGIKIEWLIYRFGGYDPFGKTPLSAADPEQFRTSFQAILDRLEAKSITLAGFELGNEINLSGTNPEFDTPKVRARQLSLNDLQSDPEGRRVASGYLRYLQLLAVVKQSRDRSKLNRRSPIMNAGLGTYDRGDGPLPAWAKGDMVGIDTTLRFLRAHGLDDLVDAYAVHIYPDTKRDGPDAAASRKALIDRYDLGACRAAGSPDGKPCWVTEWGLDNNDTTCPIDDAERARLTKEIAGDFRPYVRQGRLFGLLYFAWNSTPNAPTVLTSSIWRCGALTEAGKIAIAPDAFR